MNKILAVSYGGGVNSTAMLIEMFRRGVRPDLITFADTGGERPETYAFVGDFSAWLIERNMPEIITVRSPNDTLESASLRNKSLPSIAYGFKTCSQRFKAQPQEVFTNHFQPARDAWARGEKVIKAIGYDLWEQRRAKNFESDKYQNWYPLIEWEMGRDDCERVCREVGLYPAKSSCFFCPSMKPVEIKQLAREHPDLAQRAIEMERNAELKTVKGLGRNFAWEKLIAADRAQFKMFEDVAIDTEMPCDCYDG